MTGFALNPIALFALQTHSTVGDGPPQHRSYLYCDHQAAEEAGRAMLASKPSELSSFTWEVVSLEGPAG